MCPIKEENSDIMYKELIKLIALFISKPSKGWAYILTKNTADEHALNAFAYPLMGLGALTAFIFALLNHPDGTGFQFALKEASFLFISSFVGLYTASFLIGVYYEKVCGEKLPFGTTMKFVIFSSTVLFIINFFSHITDSIFFLQIFSLYTIYIVWEGSLYFLKIDEKKRAGFALFSSFSIILSPLLMGALIKYLMPGLQ